MTSATNERIQEVEAQLGVTFADDYKNYIAAFGVAAYDGHEFTGISDSPRLDVVNVTLEERRKYPGLSSDWYVIEQLHIDDVSVWQTGSGEVYQIMPAAQPMKLHDSLVAYIEG